MGLGGYYYDPKYFRSVVDDFIRYYQLDNNSSILDVGCGKGFLLYDFTKVVPDLELQGIDISEYAIANAKEEIKGCLQVGNATSLPYPDNYFDFVFSITTLHNLPCYDLDKALREIERVSKKN